MEKIGYIPFNGVNYKATVSESAAFWEKVYANSIDRELIAVMLDQMFERAY